MGLLLGWSASQRSRAPRPEGGALIVKLRRLLHRLCCLPLASYCASKISLNRDTMPMRPSHLGGRRRLAPFI